MDAKNKTCRNCGGSEFYTQNTTAFGDAGAMLPIGAFSAREFRVRVCGGCGLVEWFVSSKSLAKVKEKFENES